MVARTLGPEMFGVFSLVIWYARFARGLINSGVAIGATRFVAQCRARNEIGQARAVVAKLAKVQWLKILAVVLIFGAVLAFRPETLPDPVLTHVSSVVLWAMLVAIAARTNYMFKVAVAKGDNDFRSVSIIAIIGAPLNLILVAFGALTQQGVNYFIATFVASGLVFFIASTWRTWNLTYGPRDAQIAPETSSALSKHLRYLTWSGMIGFLVSAGVEVAFLAYYATPQEVGFFRLAMQTAAAVTLLIPGIFGGILLPLVAQAAANSTKDAAEQFAKSTCYSWILVAPLLVYVAVYAVPVIELVYGSEFGTAGWVLGFTILGAGLRNVGPAAQAFLLSINVQRLLLVATVVGVVLKLTLAWLLVKRWGLSGAIASYLTLEIGFVVFKISLAIHFGGVSPPWSRMFRTLVATVPGLLLGLIWFATGLPNWTAIIFGCLSMTAYVLTTLWCGTWTREDISYMNQLSERIPLAGSWMQRLFHTARTA